MSLISWEANSDQLVGKCGKIIVAYVQFAPLKISVVGERLVREVDSFTLSMPSLLEPWGNTFSTQEAAMKEAEIVLAKLKKNLGW